ncbi:hypothetical protein LXA43DRAFT_205426 [Ganoderma leucocontextum]|nr:hypothetical protein LXA43DRAFT_205426 [Ganoderma leucocontextum]
MARRRGGRGKVKRGEELFGLEFGAGGPGGVCCRGFLRSGGFPHLERAHRGQDACLKVALLLGWARVGVVLHLHPLHKRRLGRLVLRNDWLGWDGSWRLGTWHRARADGGTAVADGRGTGELGVCLLRRADYGGAIGFALVHVARSVAHLGVVSVAVGGSLAVRGGLAVEEALDCVDGVSGGRSRRFSGIIGARRPAPTDAERVKGGHPWWSAGKRT